MTFAEISYEEALERNRNDEETHGELIPFMERIVAEHGQELDLSKDGNLIDTAAEKMIEAEIDRKPITTDEALELARAYAENVNAMLDDYFSDEEYDDMRGFIDLVRRENPDIADTFTIETAASEIQDSADNGVELSVSNALRMVKGTTPTSWEEFLSVMDEVSSAGEDVAALAAEALDQAYKDGEARRNAHAELSRAAIHKRELLESSANRLTNNSDIILLGRPIEDSEADWMQLELGFFSEHLNVGEIAMLTDMKSFADETAVINKENYIRVVFKINNIWETK